MRFDAERKHLWQRFTTSAGRLSEAISARLGSPAARLHLQASGLVCEQRGAKDKWLVTPFLKHSLPSHFLFVCLYVLERREKGEITLQGARFSVVQYITLKSHSVRELTNGQRVINLLVLMSPLFCFRWAF